MEKAMKFEIPQPMKLEHDELHEALVGATKAGGQTGEAAKAVAKVLHPHFVKEEEYALPPLGLLPALAQGKVEPAMAEVLAMTDKLEAELPQMLAEHKQIVAALEKLVAAAKAEDKPDVADFAAKLILHAQTEEQVAYPTALLIGRYVKVNLTARLAA
jgi:Hemerythrin HHE cation binding domain